MLYRSGAVFILIYPHVALIETWSDMVDNCTKTERKTLNRNWVEIRGGINRIVAIIRQSLDLLVGLAVVNRLYTLAVPKKLGKELE